MDKRNHNSEYKGVRDSQKTVSGRYKPLRNTNTVCLGLKSTQLKGAVTNDNTSIHNAQTYYSSAKSYCSCPSLD